MKRGNKHAHSGVKKGIAFFLVLCMVLSLNFTQVLAEGEDDQSQAKQEEQGQTQTEMTTETQGLNETDVNEDHVQNEQTPDEKSEEADATIDNQQKEGNDSEKAEETEQKIAQQEDASTDTQTIGADQTETTPDEAQKAVLTPKASMPEKPSRVLRSGASVLEYNSSADTQDATDPDFNFSDPPEHQKVIKYNKEKDDYTLTLNVKGKHDIKGENDKPLVDVVVIVDSSGSMAWDMDGNEIKKNSNSDSRIQQLKNIITEQDGLSDSILNNEKVDGRMAIVDYNGDNTRDILGTWVPGSRKQSGHYEYSYDTYNDANHSSWYTEKSQLDNYVGKIQANGGTNCQAGIVEAEDVLKGSREDAQKYVIFLADGEATFYYSAKNENINIYNNGSNLDYYPANGPLVDTYNWRYGNPEDVFSDGGITLGPGNGQSDESEAAAEKEVTDNLQGLDGFYTVGISSSPNQEFLGQLAKNSNTKYGVYSATNTNALDEIFGAIANKITTYACKDITITDTLSDYAEMVNPSSEAIKTEIRDDKDNLVTDPNEINAAGFTANYKDGVITADFADSYEVKENWTYSISFDIQPTQAAYNQYAKIGSPYPATGDKDTDAPGNDTSSEEPGFYSNVSAKLDYTYLEKDNLGQVEKETEGHSGYDMPVIQVHTIQIKKVWENIAGTKIDGGTQGLQPVNVTLLDNNKSTGDVVALNNGNKWEATLAITVTNKEQPNSITITKNVTGAMGDKTKSFKFTMTLRNNGAGVTGTYKDESGNTTLEFKDGTAIFELKDKQSIQALNLPTGAEYSITEENLDTDGYTVTYTNEKGTIAGKQEVTIKNNKDLIIESGVRGNNMTMGILLSTEVIMIGCAAWLLISRRRKH